MQTSIWISIHTAISIFILLGLFWALYIGNEGVALNNELRREQAALQVQLENLMDLWIKIKTLKIKSEKCKTQIFTLKLLQEASLDW